jgi:hypothetical protein
MSYHERCLILPTPLPGGQGRSPPRGPVGGGSNVAVATQRGDIATAQNVVSHALRGTTHSIVRRFETVPLMAVVASPDALRTLEAMRGLSSCSAGAAPPERMPRLPDEVPGGAVGAASGPQP